MCLLVDTYCIAVKVSTDNTVFRVVLSRCFFFFQDVRCLGYEMNNGRLFFGTGTLVRCVSFLVSNTVVVGLVCACVCVQSIQCLKVCVCV